MPPPALVKPDPKAPTKRSLVNLIIDWISFLNGISGFTSGVINGGMEKYTGSNNVPDGWTFTPYPNGAGAIDTTTQSDGLNSFKIVVPSGGGSNGGGYLETTDFIAVTNIDDYFLKWKYKTSVATVLNQVEIRWHTSAQAFISSSVIWSESSGGSSTWVTRSGSVLTASIPSNARFYKIRLTGGSVGSDAGNVWYDEVETFRDSVRNENIVVLTVGSGTWTAPLDVTKVRVRAWGGGGGASANGHIGGGGGHGEGFFSVIPGKAYAYVVGAGGTVGVAGGNTTFLGATCNGGAGATAVGGGAGGATSGFTISVGGTPGTSVLSPGLSFGGSIGYGAGAGAGADARIFIEY